MPRKDVILYEGSIKPVLAAGSFQDMPVDRQQHHTSEIQKNASLEDFSVREHRSNTNWMVILLDNLSLRASSQDLSKPSRARAMVPGSKQPDFISSQFPNGATDLMRDRAHAFR
jgi:hypothetical protein